MDLNSDFLSPILLFALHNFASHCFLRAAVDLCLNYSILVNISTYLFYTSKKRKPNILPIYSSKVLRIAMGCSP